MILIADSGSTKTDWCVAEGGKAVLKVTTAGTNPFFQSPEEIEDELSHALFPLLADYHISYIYFYGAGLVSQAKKQVIADIIAPRLNAQIEVYSDLMAAARALCGNKPGIACILGTGSNSCLYDGVEIIEHTPPLGFILGDEGSGAYLGKRLVGDYLKRQLPKSIEEKFFMQYELTQDILLERVYRQPFPNRFLASLTPFLSENIADETVYNLVYSSFTEFIKRNIIRYTDMDKYSICFTGSIAFHFEEVLRQAVLHQGLQVGTISKAPMDGLIHYHNNNK